MRAPAPRHLLIAFSTLLLMGSSGCTLTDVNDILGFGGTSNTVDGVDIVTHALGGSTGDDGKDAVLQAGDSLTDTEEVNRLEEIAESSLSTRPPTPGYALIQIKAALKLRPNDWSLINKRSILLAELGKDAEGFRGTREACAATMPDQRGRCVRAVMRERHQLMEESVVRQKGGPGLVTCATYQNQALMYRTTVSAAGEPNSFFRYTPAQIEDFKARAARAEAFAKQPGETCAITPVEVNAPVVPGIE